MKQAILAVDDHSENLLVLEQTLADMKAELVKATSGEMALEKSLHRNFAMAILDVRMPDMDGYELAELLRGNPETRHLPIIFLTAGSGEEEQIFKGYASGAVDYMVKPFNPSILQAKVRVFLELERQRLELEEYRKHLQQLVEERTEDLERSNRELEQFAYVASHDLQEPLRMVASYTQLLAERYKGKLDEKADKYIGYAIDGALRMQRLIDDLLTFSRMGKEGVHLEAVDSGEVLNSVLHDLKKGIGENETEILTSELPQVLSDRTHLEQVFQNLISNAIKFNNEKAPRIDISAERLGNFCEFRIADNGIGIDPQYFDKIFTIFQRLHRRDKYPGSGIGLAIVKKIVEQHGGEIRVESAEGQGTCMIFTLPAAHN